MAISPQTIGFYLKGGRHPKGTPQTGGFLNHRNRVPGGGILITRWGVGYSPPHHHVDGDRLSSKELYSSCIEKRQKKIKSNVLTTRNRSIFHMFSTEIQELSTNGYRLRATCPKCAVVFTFNYKIGAKTRSKTCPNCKKSQRFTPPEPLDYSDKKEEFTSPTPEETIKHTTLDKEQSAKVENVMSEIAEEAKKVFDNLDDQKRKELEAKISALFPQGQIFTMGLEMYLKDKLPPERAKYHAEKLGPNLDLLAQKYGYVNIFGAYGLEIMVLAQGYGIRKEMIEYAKAHPKKEKKEQTPGLESEAKNEIEKKSK